MTKKEFEDKLAIHQIRLDCIFKEMAEDINSYMTSNEDLKVDQLNYFENLVDSFIMSGAYLNDRLYRYAHWPSGYNYKKSMTKKIRKILGYTI